MKKLLLTTAVLLMAFVAQAQTKIAPKLENGFKAVYTDVSTIEAAQTPIKVTSETEYAVSNVTPNGAVITVTTTSVKTDADESNPMMAIMTAASKMLEGVAVKFNTDADGQVLSVANLDEVKAKASAMAKTLIDKIFENNPSIADMVPREGLEKQFADSMSEKAFIASVTTNSVLGLNGKTIANGATDSGEIEGMKTKRMFFVAGKKIIVNSTLDMTKEELKDLIVKKVAEQAPDQAEMVKQNIDLVMDQMKPEISAKVTYTMQDNGWPLSITSEMTQTMMGQTEKHTEVTTLKQ